MSYILCTFNDFGVIDDGMMYLINKNKIKL